jgi:beta-lactamase class A
MPLDSPARQEGRHYRSRLRRQTRLALSWGAAALIILATVTLAVIRSGPSPWSESPAASAAEARGLAAAAIPEGLRDSIDRILRGAEGYRVGVALAAVAGGQTRTYGEESSFAAASTAKVITATAYYHLVETGEATLEQKLGAYSAAFQLEAMINTATMTRGSF